MAKRKLTQDELRRYSRHISLPEIGITGQEKLKDSAVLCVGAGGLGSPLAMYLAAAGIGKLGIIDFDRVDESNLQRQLLHGQSDIGRLKAESATDRLKEINPHIEIQAHQERLDSSNALEIIKNFDVVADGTDNFGTRYLINDACVMLKKSNVHAAINRFEGQLSVFSHGEGPCYRCLFPQPPDAGSIPNCAEAGVMGVLPGVMGCLQATEVIKVLLQLGQPLVGKLLTYQALEMTFRTLSIDRDPACPVCGAHPSITTLTEEKISCASKTPAGVKSVFVNNWQEFLAQEPDIQLVDVREDFEVAICAIENSQHIPLGTLEDRWTEIRCDRPVLFICKAGMRSQMAAEYLVSQGHSRVFNLDGGILAYAQQVDCTMPTY